MAVVHAARTVILDSRVRVQGLEQCRFMFEYGRLCKRSMAFAFNHYEYLTWKVEYEKVVREFEALSYIHNT
jgi:hypothetical protein